MSCGVVSRNGMGLALLCLAVLWLCIGQQRSSSSTPGLGTSMCCRCGPKKQKNKKEHYSEIFSPSWVICLCTLDDVFPLAEVLAFTVIYWYFLLLLGVLCSVKMIFCLRQGHGGCLPFLLKAFTICIHLELIFAIFFSIWIFNWPAWFMEKLIFSPRHCSVTFVINWGIVPGWISSWDICPFLVENAVLEILWWRSG